MEAAGLWIRNALLIDPRGRRRADVLVRGERIAEVVRRDRTAAEPAAAASPAGTASLDAEGLWLLPGGVDGHVHFGMPVGDGLTSLGWRPSSEAALLGGTTTVVDFANPTAGEPVVAAVERTLTAAAGGPGGPAAACVCDHGLHATYTDVSDARLDELDALLARGICTFKAFLAYPGRLMLSRPEMGRLMTAVAARGGRLMVHAEDGPTCAAAERALLQTGRTAAAWHPQAHPPRAELEAVEAVLALAERAGCPLTLAHLSLAGSVARLTAARRALGPRAAATGSELAGEVCLHHLLLDRSLYAASQESALRAILSPPLREPEEARALLAALAGGELDLLATDHCEFPLAVKAERARHGFAAVPNGAGGVGERLTISHALAVATGRLTAERWVEVCCEAPARLLGLARRKGRIVPGLDADLVLFDPAAEHRWAPLPGSDPDASLWAGTPCRGRVRDVMLRGRWVVRQGALQPDLEPGRYLSRSFAGGAG